MTLPGRMLRGAVLITVLAALALPILAGLGLTLAASLGYLPAIGARTVSVQAFSMMFGLPGLGTSLRLTLVTGIGSTLLALSIAIALLVRWPGAARLLPVLLATPHAALALGLAFLLSPSGWISRGLAPLLGWGQPPDVATVNDPMGLALIFGLLVKEVPFLLLMLLAAERQIPWRRHMALGQAMGHGPASVWIKIVVPQLYPLIRLPLFIVLAFALSVVDMAMILGPSHPPTLAVALTRWFNDPDPAMILPASAGAMLLVTMTGGSIGLWMAAERAVARLGRLWLRRGGRGRGLGGTLALPAAMGRFALLLGLCALLVLAVWSLAWRWPYPALLPDSWGLRGWMRADWAGPLVTMLTIALTTTTLSLLLAIAWLEGEDRGHLPRARWATGLIVLPLLLPQIGFLYGLHALFLKLGICGCLWAVIWAQVLFVFPYVMLALSEPWRSLDPRHMRSAAALGAGPLRRLVAVKLPLLIAPVLASAALGIAVSVTQYLPTLFMGAGRVTTLTTEAVTLASGADRRVTAIYGLLLAVLPLCAYGLALRLPGLIFRNRRDMSPRHDT